MIKGFQFTTVDGLKKQGFLFFWRPFHEKIVYDSWDGAPPGSPILIPAENPPLRAREIFALCALFAKFFSAANDGGIRATRAKTLETAAGREYSVFHVYHRLLCSDFSVFSIFCAAIRGENSGWTGRPEKCGPPPFSVFSMLVSPHRWARNLWIPPTIVSLVCLQ